MKKLAEAALQEVQTGLMPGMNVLDALLWADARNVHFTQFGAVAMRGALPISFNDAYFDSHAGLFDDAAGLFDEADAGDATLVSPATTAIRGMLAFREASGSGAVQFVFSTRDKIWCYIGGATAAEVKSGLAGIADATATQVATMNSLVSWGDWFLSSNGIDPIQICKDGLTAADLTGTPPTRARLLAKLGPHVVAFNTDLGGNYAEWCAEDNVEEWDPLADVTAGNLPVRDLENDITAVVPLGDNLAVYTENEIQIMSYGGALQFGTKPSLENLGAFGAYSVCRVDRLNYGLYYNGIFATDGYSSQPIVEPQLGRWLEKNVNWDQRSKIVAWFDANRKSINFSVPLVGNGEPSRIISLDAATKALTFRDQGVSSAIPASVYKYSVVGTTGGKLFLDEAEGMSFDGAAINAYIQTKPLEFGEEQAWKTIQRFRSKWKNRAGNVELYLGSSEQPDSTIDWQGPFSIDADYSELFPEVGFQFLHVKFQSQDAAAEWTFTGFRADGVVAGAAF
jgi:hypothetical protein